MRRLPQHLNKIIHNSHFKEESVWRNKRPRSKDRFLRGRQIAYLIYDYFRVTGSHDSVENYTDLFTIVLRNDDIQEFDSKWDGILLSLTKIPHDDILEGLHKLRIRESEKLKTVLELYDLEIHQKKIGPDLSQIEDKGEKKYRARFYETGMLRPDMEILKQAPWSRIKWLKQREQRSLGDCWQWKPNGQCSKGDNCSVRYDINKRAKSTQPNPSPSFFMRQNERNASRTRSPRGRSPNGKMARLPCKIYLERTCTTPFCEKSHPPECLFYKSVNGCRFGKSVLMHIARLMNSVAKGQERMVTKVQWLR